MTAINDQPLTSTAATTNDAKYEPSSYDSLDIRPREVGKPYPLAKKYKFGKTFWIERPDDGEQIIIQAFWKERPDETLNVDLPAYFLRATKLRMDTFQGTDVQVPPRDLVELPRQLLGYQAATRRRPPVLHQQGQRNR